MNVTKEVYGVLENGEQVERFTITAPNGALASVITYGATIDRVCVPDRDGKLDDVLKSFDDIEGFEKRCNYQGMTVAPYANRIGAGKFTLDGKEYALTQNEKGVTNLHSAGELSRRVWKGEAVGDKAVKMSISREDGVGGIPGNMTFEVVFTFDGSSLEIAYHATTDKDTYINPTNHAYFNLAGQGSDTNLDHVMRINAECFTPVDEYSIPTGELKAVEGTPFDFRTPHAIGERIQDDCRQLKLTGGYDHNFCIKDYDGSLKECAFVEEPTSGRTMSVLTDLPGVQFYAGNFLSGAAGKGGRPLGKRCSFCLETQYFPDTPNKPEFPSCLVKAGEEFSSKTVYKFSVK